MQKQLDAQKERREAEAEEDDEFQDADEGDDDPEKSKEEWQNELDDLKAEVADNRKKVKAVKSKAQKEKLELSMLLLFYLNLLMTINGLIQTQLQLHHIALLLKLEQEDLSHF